jgi:hypothetical protein
MTVLPCEFVVVIGTAEVTETSSVVKSFVAVAPCWLTSGATVVRAMVVAPDERLFLEYGAGVNMATVVEGAAISSERTPPLGREITVVTPAIR